MLIILIPLVWAQIGVQTAAFLLTHPASLKAALRTSTAYSELQAMAADQFVTQVRRSGELAVLTPADLRVLANQLLPANQMQLVAETAIDGLSEWLRTGTDRPSIVLDLSWLRQAMPGALRVAVAAKTTGLPACTPAQTLALTSKSGGVTLTCKPDDAVLTAVINQVMASRTLDAIPARIDLAASMDGSTGTLSLDRANERLAFIRFYLRLVPLGWVVLAVLLGLLALLNLDRWYTPFGWISAALFLGGGLPLAGSLLAGWLTVGFMPVATAGDSSAALLHTLAGAGVTWAAGALLTVSLAVTLAGLACLITTVVGVRMASTPSQSGTGTAA